MTDLGRSLFSLVAEVAACAEIVITRHKSPVARLLPPESTHVHVGDKIGRAGISPLHDGPTRGRYLESLEEDRGGYGRRPA